MNLHRALAVCAIFVCAFGATTTTRTTTTRSAKSEPQPRGPQVTLHTADDSTLTGWITGLDTEGVYAVIKNGSVNEKKTFPLTDLVDIVYSTSSSSGSHTTSSGGST